MYVSVKVGRSLGIDTEAEMGWERALPGDEFMAQVRREWRRRGFVG